MNPRIVAVSMHPPGGWRVTVARDEGALPFVVNVSNKIDAYRIATFFTEGLGATSEWRPIKVRAQP